MNITIIGFVRCGFGTSAGASIIERSFAKLSIEYGTVDAIRDCFGIGSWVCLAMMIIILLSNFKSLPRTLVPRIITVAKMLRRH